MSNSAEHQVVVYGASGHGKVVAEVVRSTGATLLGFIDDGIPSGTMVLGLPVLGNLRWLEQQPRALVVVPAIGSNATRQQVCARVEALGLTVGSSVHRTAWVSPTATLGAGTVVMALAVVNAEAHVGRGVILNTACVVEHECVIGDFAHISPNAALGGGTRVGARSHVGIGASVLQLARVGVDCVVGAGAVVLKEVADGATVVGVPARPVR